MEIEAPTSVLMMVVTGYVAIFIVCAVVGFIVVTVRGRKGKYRAKLHDDRKELEDHFNGYQPNLGATPIRPPGDE